MINQIVRIIKDGKCIDIFHGSYDDFNKYGYKNYERPYIAEYCEINVIDVAEYTDTKR